MTMPTQKKPSLLSSAYLGLAATCILACLCTDTSTAVAVDTSSFDLDSEKDFEPSKMDGVAVDSTGMLVHGVRTTRLSLKEATIAKALLTTANGTSYVGTGTKGVVYQLKGNTLRKFAETGALMATSLAEDGQGNLFIGTTPGGKVMRADAAGKVDTFASLKGADHIWALAFDKRKQRLYAATGPEGKVFTIDRSGKAEVYFDSDAEHIMSLALADDGVLYAGTTDEGLLLEISAPGKAHVLYDFEANEITAIALRENVLAVAANTFPSKNTTSTAKPRKIVVSVPTTKNSTTAHTTTSSTSKASTTSLSAALASLNKQRAGKGQLWQVDRGGAARKLYDENAGHLTAVAWSDADHVLVATSKEGKVHRVSRDGTYSLWVDVDEKEVLAIDLSAKAPRMVTGDGAALYTLSEDGKQGGTWVSETLDAEVAARFGQLTFRGKGAISLETRSGNTKKPDASWSPWSAALTKPGPIHSPAARFLQIRATLNGNAQLFAISAFYLPSNQAPIMQSVEVEPITSVKSSSTSKSTTKSKSKPKPTTATSIYKVHWKVENSDNDRLRYRLWYRPEAETAFRPMHRDNEVLTQPTFTWNTDAVPDGYYVVRVEASDELQNDASLALRTHAQSEPVLIDNHPPHISKLSRRGDALTGTVEDSLGPISSLEYKVDTDPWKPLLCEDGLLDTEKETFKLPLPKDLTQGTHVIAIRTTDMRNNSVSAEWEYAVK